MYAVRFGSLYVGQQEGSTFLCPANQAWIRDAEAEIRQFMTIHGFSESKGYHPQRGHYIVRHPSDAAQYLHGTTALHGAAVWAANREAAMQFPTQAAASEFMRGLHIVSDVDLTVNSTATLVTVLP